MRESRFTEGRIVGILKQGEAGVPLAEILRQHNISKATYFHWRAKCAGASLDELKRLKELEADCTAAPPGCASTTGSAQIGGLKVAFQSLHVCHGDPESSGAVGSNRGPATGRRQTSH